MGETSFGGGRSVRIQEVELTSGMVEVRLAQAFSVCYNHGNESKLANTAANHL